MSEESSAKLAVPPRSPSKKTKEEYVADLKRQRGNLKGRMTQFKKFVDSLHSDSQNLTKLQVEELKLRIQSASDIFQRFNVVESELELFSSESDLPSNLEYTENAETLYFNSMASANCLIKCYEVGDSSGDAKSGKTNKSIFSNVKLPDIKLPTFDGSYDHWLEFKNSYITMIHERSDLDVIQKFHYLRSSLSGSALQVIGALEFTAPNYAHAWALLENRFNNVRLLTHNHVKSLFTIPNLKQESAAQIRKLIDTILRNLRALKTLNEPTDSWDTLIIYLIVTKLDVSTEREWENHKGSLYSSSLTHKPKLDDLLAFLRNRADVLEMINATNSKPHHKPHVNEYKPTQALNSYVATSNNHNKISKFADKQRNKVCVLCNDNHALYSCFKFLNMSIRDRIDFVNAKQLCSNCLRAGHSLNDCLFGPCKQCKEKHNSLLHSSINVKESVRTEPPPTAGRSSFHTTATSMHCLATERVTHANASNTTVNKSHTRSRVMLEQVILSTAIVQIADSNNKFHLARALLDNGSQHSFMSEKLCKRLYLKCIQSTVRISGVGKNVTHSNQLCDIFIRSVSNDYNIRLQCVVLPHITTSLPLSHIDLNCIPIPENIQLADPTFDVPSEIDLLIGADKFWELLHEDRIRLPNGPYLQNSKLGWLISGPVYSKNLQSNETRCNFTQDLDVQLRKFWELEEVSHSADVTSHDERLCEDLFVNTTKRDITGRFSVRIPLREPANSLGDSYTLAKQRFFNLERKLQRYPILRRMYCDFIREYIELGHMTRLDNYSELNYFMPHHGVLRESSSTTKLRVVFDASAKTSTQKSLNDIQFPGPALQNDIVSILLRFRQYKYVACADVEKFFRQVLIQPDQRSLQLILWRNNPTDSLSVYQLNTVTYGTASAPYLSMRCIRQLASECDDVTKRVITEDLYVDDLITGCDDHKMLLSICENVSNILKSGCFPLHKWTFNFDKVQDTSDIFKDDLTQSKTLGLGWLNDSDEFYFQIHINSDVDSSKLTKRMILSMVSQIYDPLGLLAPSIVIVKILLQRLWLSKLDWDTPVPREIVERWKWFEDTLGSLKKLKLPRHIRRFTKYTELHIFTDASQDAYGACAYIRTYDDNYQFSVNLLCAKGKVAPLKTVTIPRLELCGALVGAKLYKKIIDSLRLTFNKIFFWTDSTIVMGWIRMPPHLLKTFVQNRVSELNDLTKDSPWLHVKSEDNPADLLSRGVNFDNLINCDLWWHGPSFLHSSNSFNTPDSKYIHSLIDTSDLPDTKKLTTLTHLNLVGIHFIDFKKYSSYQRLKRVFAYVLRFSNNIRISNDCQHKRQTGLLSVAELEASQRVLIHFAQLQSFPCVYDCLNNNIPIDKCNKNKRETNRVLGLNLFLDNHKLIRVGGRLNNSLSFDYNKKHPILLCCGHHLTVLLFRYKHKQLMHASPLLLISHIREAWWPLRARNLAKRVVNECVICTRIKGKTLTPIMGNLPSERLDPGFPFIKTGVDYAGPVFILNRKGRGARLLKAYICLFVCFATRAMHLELVTSLSSSDYILALKRFLSRRGKPQIMFSDNGKTFVGAEKEFRIFLKDASSKIIDYSSENGIQFKFIPPYSPHFGGLWESGVRSCKYHLRRIVGNANLTYEEFYTVLTQVEAVLNSRPLSPLSSDPHDLLPLTPAHFLIGRTLTAPEGDDITAEPSSRLTRYTRLEQLRQHFWQRWSREYVTELQQRTKWKTKQKDIGLDTLVIIKEDNQPPLRWKLGRIVKIFPGTDGVSRVADIRTATGIIRRAFSKICPLQLPEENESA